MGPRVVHRVGQRERIIRAAEAHEDDLHAVVGGPQHAGDDVRVGPRTVRAEDLDRRHAHAGVSDAGHADAVVHVRGRDARERGAVPVRIDVRIATGEARAKRDTSGEIGMARVDAGVEHRNRRGARDRHVRVRLIPRDLREGPLLRIGRIARVAGLANPHRRRGVLDERVRREGGEDPVGRAGGDGDDAGPELIKGAGGGPAQAVHGRVDVGGAGRGLELHEEGDGECGGGWTSYLIGDRGGARRRLGCERRGAAHREQHSQQRNKERSTPLEHPSPPTIWRPVPPARARAMAAAVPRAGGMTMNEWRRSDFARPSHLLPRRPP